VILLIKVKMLHFLLMFLHYEKLLYQRPNQIIATGNCFIVNMTKQLN